MRVAYQPKKDPNKILVEYFIIDLYYFLNSFSENKLGIHGLLSRKFLEEVSELLYTSRAIPQLIDEKWDNDLLDIFEANLELLLEESDDLDFEYILSGVNAHENTVV